MTPIVEILLGVRAILPLVLFLMGVLFFILRSSLPNRLITLYGLTLSVVGMCIFNVGLTYGLGAIGAQTGSILPAAFMELPVSKFSYLSRTSRNYNCYWLCIFVRFWCHFS